MSKTDTRAGTPPPTLAPTLARLEALQQEAERLATTETGQARAFNQGRAAAFKLTLEDLREAGQ